MLLLELLTDTIFLIFSFKTHTHTQTHAQYNDEKKLLINYLRCLPVVLGTALVRRTLQETSVHNELNLQTNVCCLSTQCIYLYIYFCKCESYMLLMEQYGIILFFNEKTKMNDEDLKDEDNELT